MKNVKRTLVRVFTVFVVVFGLTGCGEKKDGGHGEEHETPTVEAPAQIVSVAQAKDTYNEYTKRRARLIEKYEDSINREKEIKDTFDIARYTFYDLKTIKQYIAYIEQEAKKADLEISTLRFYFSNYGDKTAFDSGREVKHPRQNSIFIMPTIKKDGKDFGFFIRRTEGKAETVLLTYDLREYDPKGMGSTYGGDDKSYATFAPNIKWSNSAASPLFFDDESFILNEGNSAPPPY
ncbi:hypothetical protein WIW50_15335 [Flavobacteriaceae bacterium 3-367]|uniref:hypothetical protein n=1 Tax=Eudoraea algarum TaxID=3417568 RepID=UPI00328FB282